MLRSACLLTALAIVVAPVATHADPAPATADALAQAKAHFAQGKAFLDAKVYDQAIVEFEAAYKLSPFPELLFNVGQAYRLGGQPAKALAAYREFLQSTLSGALADEARVHVAELTAIVEQTQASDAAAQQAAQAAHDKQQAAYDLDHEEHTTLAHKRHVGHVEMIIGGVATVAGVVLFVPDPSATPTGPLGVGLIIAGLVTVLVGGVTTAQGTDLLPVLPPPAPLAPAAPHAALASVGWSWRF